MRSSLAEPELDPRHAVGDLAGHELEAAPRRLVVEQDARAGEQVVALAVVDRDVVPVDLRHAIRAARIERRLLALRHRPHLAEHLAGRRLVEPDLGVDLADRFERAGHALGVVLAGEQRLIPRRRHERHRRQVVELLRPHLVEDLEERQLVEQVGRPQLDAVEDVLDAPQVGRARAAHDAVDLVALVEKPLGQVGAVLAGDAGDQRASLHDRDLLTAGRCGRRGGPSTRCACRGPAATWRPACRSRRSCGWS